MMKRKATVLICLLFCLTAAMICAGCSGGGSEGSEGGEAGGGSAGVPKFDFSGIEWSVGSGVTDGYRTVMFSYDNGSEYDIAELSLKYKLKADVTDEEIKAFDELTEKAKNQEEELSELTIEAWAERIVESGGSAENIPMQLDGTVEYFNTYDAYDLFEPDIMTVIYIKGDKLYTAYYDYSNQETSYDEDVMDAYTWSDSDLAKLLPKPDAAIVAVSYDDEKRFHATIYGVSKDFYEDYIKQCKEKGFTKNVNDDSDWSWWAEDENGNKVDMIFVDTDGSLDISIDAPSE